MEKAPQPFSIVDCRGQLLTRLIKIISYLDSEIELSMTLRANKLRSQSQPASIFKKSFLEITSFSLEKENSVALILIMLTHS